MICAKPSCNQQLSYFYTHTHTQIPLCYFSLLPQQCWCQPKFLTAILTMKTTQIESMPLILLVCPMLSFARGISMDLTGPAHSPVNGYGSLCLLDQATGRLPLPFSILHSSLTPWPSPISLNLQFWHLMLLRCVQYNYISRVWRYKTARQKKKIVTLI